MKLPRSLPFDRELPVRLEYVVVVLAGDLGQPEVADLDATVLGDEDVSRGEIAVDYALAAEIIHARGDVESEAEEFLVGQALAVDGQVALQGAVLDELHDQADLGLGDHAEDPDDVRVLQSLGEMALR